MKWNTAISTKKEGEVYVRGEALSKLMTEKSFTEVAFLLLAERLPDAAEKTLFDMILVSCIEHGVEAPTGFTPRVSVSVGNPMNAVMAAGLLAMGDHHGGAIEACAQMLAAPESAEEIVNTTLAAGKRLPGFGHMIYKDADPRAELLLAKAQELGKVDAYVAKVRAIQTELQKQSGKQLPLNIDGAIAALMCEMKLDWRLGKAIFGLSRMPGMIAHAHEEMLNEKPYRRFDDGDVTYTGK